MLNSGSIKNGSRGGKLVNKKESYRLSVVVGTLVFLVSVASHKEVIEK